tara:strand:+ start:167 stop:967 length:801 start_codon:yes stop_codon:yes gene_type:complete
MSNGNNNNGNPHSQIDNLINMSNIEYQYSQVFGPEWKETVGQGIKKSGSFTTLGDLGQVVTESKQIKPSILTKLLGGIEKFLPGGKTGERGEDLFSVEGAFPWLGIYGTETPGEGTQHYKATGRGGSYDEALKNAKTISQSKALFQPESQMTESPIPTEGMETVKSKLPIENILGELFKGTVGKGHEFMKQPSYARKALKKTFPKQFKTEYKTQKDNPYRYAKDEEGNRIEDEGSRYMDLLGLLIGGYIAKGAHGIGKGVYEDVIK